MYLSKCAVKSIAKFCDAPEFKLSHESKYAFPQVRVDAFDCVSAIAVANSAAALVICSKDNGTFDRGLRDTPGSAHYILNKNPFIKRPGAVNFSILEKYTEECVFYDGAYKTKGMKAKNENFPLIIDEVNKKVFGNEGIHDITFLLAFLNNPEVIRVKEKSIFLYGGNTENRTAFNFSEFKANDLDLSINIRLLRLISDCFDIIDKIVATGSFSQIVVTGITEGYLATAIFLPMKEGKQI